MSYSGQGQLSAGPKTPIAIKKQRGTYRADRDMGKIELKSMDSIPLPPDTFNEWQKDEWMKICTTLYNTGVLHEVGLFIIEIYVRESDLYLKCINEIETKGYYVDIVDAKGNKTTKKSPAVDVANLAFSKIMNIAGHFGFTPASATRIKAPGNNKEDIDPDFGF